MDKTDSQEVIVICGRLWQPAGVQRVVFALLKIKFLSLKSVVPEQNRLKWGERLTVNLINL